MAKCAVIGAKGFIGKHLSFYLNQQGHQVECYDIFDVQEKGYISYFKRINTDINRISDYFNIFNFSINNNIIIYIKKYYGTSNIYEINPDLYKNRNLSILEEPMKTYDKEISISSI